MLSHINANLHCDTNVTRELCESKDTCSDMIEMEVIRKELYY